MSHAISHQRRREGRSPAVLEAPRRELIQQRQRSPAAYPASARGRRRLCGLLVSNPSSRTPLVWQCPAARCGGTRSFRARCELTSLRRGRKCLPNHHSSRGRRLPAAGRRPRASISRQRSLLQATFFYKTFGDLAKTAFCFRGNGSWERVVSYEAGSAKNRPRCGSAGARSESRARGTGAVYGASKAPCESVIGGGDGTLVAAAPLCARSRAFVLYRARR